MNPLDMSVETWHWDKDKATTDEVKVLIEALGYDIASVYFMTSDDEPFVSSAEVTDRLPDFSIERKIDTEVLSHASHQAAADIETVLFNFVKKYGEEPTDYDINEFGLDVDQDDQQVITHVFNLFDNGGAYFAIQRKPNDDTINEQDTDSLFETFEHYAFQCLYIVESVDGSETLKYYAFENGGIEWDDNLSEPDHDSIITLRLDVLENLLRAIIKER